MQRRRMFLAALLNGSAVGFISGCRNKQYAHVLKKDDKDMVGSHVAGAETWKPLIDESDRSASSASKIAAQKKSAISKSRSTNTLTP